MRQSTGAARLAFLGIMAVSAPTALTAQGQPAIAIALQAGSFMPLGSFENHGGVAELHSARAWGLEVRHGLVGTSIGLAMRADVTTSIHVVYSIPPCTGCPDSYSANGFHAALDLDLRTRPHSGFVGYLQLGPGVRDLFQSSGGYDLSFSSQPSQAMVGMVHGNAGIERMLGKFGIDLQLGAYTGKFNRSAVTDYIATAGFRL